MQAGVRVATKRLFPILSAQEVEMMTRVRVLRACVQPVANYVSQIRSSAARTNKKKVI